MARGLCAVLSSAGDLWVLRCLGPAFFGSCAFGVLRFLGPALFGSCAFWVLRFLGPALFGSCAFWVLRFLGFWVVRALRRLILRRLGPRSPAFDPNARSRLRLQRAKPDTVTARPTS